MKTIQDYEEDFKNCIIGYCKRYNHGQYSEKDLINFESVAQNEYDGLIKNTDLKDIDFNKGEDDADECMSYWD